MIGREKRVLLRHYLEQGMPKAEIARQLEISRRTVYNWIEAGDLELDPYKGIIDARLAEYPKLSAVRLCNEVRAAGYGGGYGQVKRYVREVRRRAPWEALDDVLAGVDGGGTTAAAAIERLLAAQITLRNSRRLATAMRSSRLPAIKTLADFDFSFQPSVKRERTRAWSSGARSCTTRSWPPPCWTGCSTAATSSTSGATATGCDATWSSPKPSTQRPPAPSPRSTPATAKQGHDGCPDSIGSPRSGRSAPCAAAPGKCAFFNGQKCALFGGH